MKKTKSKQTKLKAELHTDVKAKVDSKRWFYTNIVKEHFFKPKNFMEEKQAKKYKADGVGLAGSAVCGDMMRVWLKIDSKTDKIKEMKWSTFGYLLPGAKILMSNFNTKSVENFTIGDKILGGEGKENFVEEVLVKNYKGKILTIRLSTSNFYTFNLTPNHPVLCIRRRDAAIIQRTRGTRWSDVSQEKINDSNIIVVPASDLEEGDFLLFQVPLQVEDIQKIDEDLCTLLGYYVSDGSIPSKNRVIFYFGLDENEYISEIVEIAKRRKWSYKVYKRNTENVNCVQLNEPEVVNILKTNGGAPSKKKFSQQVLLLPFKKQERIINSYINGDGWVLHQDPNWQPQYFISTSKEEIAYQLQIILGRLGIFAPIHKRESREFLSRGKKYKNSGEFNLIFRKDVVRSRVKYNKKKSSFLIPITKIEVKDYEGKIYDLGVVYEPKVYRVNGISLHNCASAIASTSMLSVMVTEKGGMKIDNALKIKPQDIIKRLGDLPQRKVHCSVLGDKALRAAINDYFRKTKQMQRIVAEGAKIVDKDTGITDKDIEEAVLEGADTLEKVQQKLKVGVSNKACIPEVEQLIRFYKEKYFGADKINI